MSQRAAIGRGPLAYDVRLFLREAIAVRFGSVLYDSVRRTEYARSFGEAQSAGLR